MPSEAAEFSGAIAEESSSEEEIEVRGLGVMVGDSFHDEVLGSEAVFFVERSGGDPVFLDLGAVFATIEQYASLKIALHKLAGRSPL